MVKTLNSGVLYGVNVSVKNLEFNSLSKKVPSRKRSVHCVRSKRNIIRFKPSNNPRGTIQLRIPTERVFFRIADMYISRFRKINQIS